MKLSTYASKVILGCALAFNSSAFAAESFADVLLQLAQNSSPNELVEYAVKGSENISLTFTIRSIQPVNSNTAEYIDQKTQALPIATQEQVETPFAASIESQHPTQMRDEIIPSARTTSARFAPAVFENHGIETTEVSLALDINIDTEQSEPEFELSLNKQLLGLFVDGIESAGLIAIFDGTEYLLPLVTILDSVGASVNETENNPNPDVLRISTPGGPAQLEPEDLKLIDGQLMVTQSGLKEKLLIDSEFNQSSFAIFLSLPWSLSSGGEYLSFDIPDPDFVPPSASLRNIRGDLSFFHDGEEVIGYGDYYTAGNLAGGTWQSRITQDNDGTIFPTEYFYTKDFGKSQSLLGNADFSLHPLLSTVEQTGAQYLYSSSPIQTRSGVDISRSNTTKSINNGVRNIAGIATPGAIAELRVDGIVRSRSRVRLDGSYEFPEVELNSRGYAEVLVYLLDNRTGALIDTHDYSRRSGIELLGNNQYSVFTAAGTEGNVFDPRSQALGSTAAVQWRYGLTEDVTLEVGHQNIGSQASSQAAVSMAIARNWFGSLAIAETIEGSSYSVELEGGGENWSVDFFAQEGNLSTPFNVSAYDVDDFIAAIPNQQENQYTKQWSRTLNVRYRVSDQIQIGLIGRDSFSQIGAERFLLPSLSWNNKNNLSVNVRPDYTGGYRVDSRYSLNNRSTVRYSFEDDSHLIDYRQRMRSGREYCANFQADEDYGDRLEVGMVTNFDNERLGRVQFGLVSFENRMGYALDWEARVLPGLNSRLRVYQGGQSQTAQYSDPEIEQNDLFVQWQLTLDFAMAQNRLVPADSQAGSLSTAALTGNLLLSDERISSDYEVDKIELLIDGDTYTANVQGGRYYIDGLEPGMHKVSIDSRHLPMELSPKQNQSFWVRLDKSAATEVPLILEEKYSIAGRVKDSEGNNMQGERLLVLDQQMQLISTAYTDQFGLYRTENLAPGEYIIVVDRNGENISAIEVAIKNAYLFEQDLAVPYTSAGVAIDL